MRNSGSLSNLTFGDLNGSTESDLPVLACTQVRPSVHSKLGAKPGADQGHRPHDCWETSNHVNARDIAPSAAGRETEFPLMHHPSYRGGCADGQKERTKGHTVRAQCVGTTNRTKGSELHEAWDVTGGAPVWDPSPKPDNALIDHGSPKMNDCACGASVSPYSKQGEHICLSESPVSWR